MVGIFKGELDWDAIWREQLGLGERKMSDLKPCPFCGGQPVLMPDMSCLDISGKLVFASVMCTDCGACVRKPYMGTDDPNWVDTKVIEKWNRRTE